MTDFEVVFKTEFRQLAIAYYLSPRSAR